MKHARIYIGTSGWSYKHWRDDIYPHGLRQSHWLAFLAARFNTVEVNSSFYRVPNPEVVTHWASLAPTGFEFALKMWRGITHYNKLKNAGRNIEKFLTVAELMPPHLRAPMLIQLPPNQGIDVEKLDLFFQQWKSSTESKWRLAVEFRHDSWLTPETVAVLNRHKAALCLHDMVGKGSVSELLNDSPFVYVRRHGPGDGRYSGRYSAAQIQTDADHIAKWASLGKDVYVYFNNDIGGHAFHNALELKQACHPT